MTLVELVVAASARLKEAGVAFGHGTTNAFDEAAWLVTWALGLPLDALESQGKRAIGADEAAKVEALLARRIETRTPTAYLTGEAWLQDIPFTVDERAIVPRSYIAELLVDVEETGTLDAWLADSTRRVLDLCTGNGSLAVIAAMGSARKRSTKLRNWHEIIHRVVRSVPPSGSGWVSRFPICNCRLPIGLTPLAVALSFSNRHSATGT